MGDYEDDEDGDKLLMGFAFGNVGEDGKPDADYLDDVRSSVIVLFRLQGLSQG